VRIGNSGRRPVILTFIWGYLPGFKAGGALRTVVNMTETLSDEFEFSIVTNDRDAGDVAPYPSVVPDRWQRVGKANVLYISPGGLTLARCKRVIETTPHDALYFQSCFSPFTLKPLAAISVGLARTSARTIVAPRGELDSGALSIRRFKKLWFLRLSRLCGFFASALWQASNANEAAAIRMWFGERAEVMVAPDLVPGNVAEPRENRKKKTGQLRAVFISRICPKKNLDGALRILMTARGEITFDIFGPAEDASYWKECQRMISALPSHIEVNYRGTLPHEQVVATLAGYDLFLFPTLGENFGHVIREALAAGCPVLISDQTPWRDLEQAGAGWDLRLDDPQAFASAIQVCVDMDAPSHETLREGARKVGLGYAQDHNVVRANRELLWASVSGRASRRELPVRHCG